MMSYAKVATYLHPTHPFHALATGTDGPASPEEDAILNTVEALLDERELLRQALAAIGQTTRTVLTLLDEAAPTDLVEDLASRLVDADRKIATLKAKVADLKRVVAAWHDRIRTLNPDESPLDPADAVDTSDA